MNKGEYSFYGIIKSFSSALDMISSEVIGHHRQTAYLALMIAKEMHINQNDIRNLLTASLIHDIGIFYLNQTLDDLSFDSKDNHHAIVGYYLVKNSFPIQGIAEIVRYHHLHWIEYKTYNNTREVPELSNILFLADRISTLLKGKDILNRSSYIQKKIKENSGKLFSPDAVAAFMNLGDKEYFWLTASNNIALNKTLDDYFYCCDIILDVEELISLSKIMSHIIDFRSSFTATHSDGVASLAEKLGAYIGLQKKEQKMLKVAGFVHDIGKLAIPLEILNKKGALTSQEWNIMRTHSYYSYYVLDQSKELGKIKEWASYHHERLDGTGYPFHLNAEELSVPARIMAIVDVFTAITEKRPYRKGMNQEKSLLILKDMIKNNVLDKDIVNALIDNYIDFNTLRKSVQEKASLEYRNFSKLLEEELNILK
ncbi:MAG: HD-GYP domain-containing protein [bacterium]